MLYSNNSAIDLIIPGLLNLPVHELDLDTLARSTPALHRLLRYAQRLPNEYADVDEVLIQRLGLSQSALPYAHAIRPEQGSRLLFRPVHLRMDVNNAIVFPVNNCNDDMDILIRDLAEFFKQDCDIECVSDNSWMMTLHHCKPLLEVPHYLSALGKKVTHYLDQAKASLEWFRLINEMQMFLYQHEVNQRRQQAGLAIINSLWCWGADEYRGEKLINTRWFCDDYPVAQLGKLYAGESEPLSTIRQANLTSPAVIVDLSLLKLLKAQTEADLMQTLISLEQQCLQPLLANTKKRINVYTGGSKNFVYNPAQRLKFWKKRVNLAELIVQSDY